MNIVDKLLRGSWKKRDSEKESGTTRDRKREREREKDWDVASARGRDPAPQHVATLSLPASSVQHERFELLLCRLKSRGTSISHGLAVDARPYEIQLNILCVILWIFCEMRLWNVPRTRVDSFRYDEESCIFSLRFVVAFWHTLKMICPFTGNLRREFLMNNCARDTRYFYTYTKI